MFLADSSWGSPSCWPRARRKHRPSRRPSPLRSHLPLRLLHRGANDLRLPDRRTGGLALRDGSLTVPNDGKTFALNKTPADVAKLLGDAGLPTTELSLSIQPLLIQEGGRLLLFDTGAGKNMGPGAGKLSVRLEEITAPPTAVSDIFISHAHGDHIGGLLNDGGGLTFPNATIHMSEAEWQSLKGMTQQAALVRAITGKVKTFTPGSVLLPDLVKAVEIKGHTPGHSGYLIGSGADTLLYVRRLGAPLDRLGAGAGLDDRLRRRRTHGAEEPQGAASDQRRVGPAHLRRALPLPGHRQIREEERKVRLVPER